MLNRVPTTDLPELPSYDPAELVPLAELAAEGFGWGSPYAKTPRDAIDVLARQLDGSIVTDDLGRRCTDRETARRLFAERAESERRQREQAERRQAELAKRPRPVAKGVPASEIPEGMTAADYLMSLDPDRQRPSVHQQLLDEELAQGRRLTEKLRGRP